MNLLDKIRSTKVSQGELAICWLGQAGYLIRDSRGNELVIDPYLTNCGERIRGFKRLSPILLQPEELTPDYYIVTHIHFDHFDYDAIPVIAKNSPKTLFLGPTSCQKELLKNAVDPSRCVVLNRGDVYQDDAIRVEAVLADHGSMAPDAIGVLLEMDGHRMYFSGDTSFREDVCSYIAGAKPEMAFLSVNGRFGNMNAEEGAMAAKIICPKYAVPCHFWTLAEHGGDPGMFCELLEHAECKPLCFYQGEVQHIDKNHNLTCRKETA